MKNHLPSPLNTRTALLITAIVVFFCVILFYAPHSPTAALATIFSSGMLALGWTIGAIALGAVILRAARIQADWLLFIATAGGIGLGIFSLAGLALGLAGWLNRGVAIAFPIVGVLALAVDFAISRSSVKFESAVVDRWFNKSAGISWLWLIPVASLATACVAASVLPGDLWKPLDPHPYDVTSYHLQVPREWFESGRITPLHHNVYSFFPFNVETQYLLLMHVTGGPWNAMYACQFLSVAYAALMLMAIAAGVGEGGVVAAALVSAVPWVIMLASVAYVESALLLYTALAIAWAVRGMEAVASSREMILAGALAGLACGVKITAVPMLLLAVPFAIVVSYVIRRSLQIKLAQICRLCAVFIITGGVVLSPWLIRNWIWCGNPVFPIAMNTLGRGDFTPAQAERFRVAHSPTPDEQSPAARVAIVQNKILADWQYGFILLPVGVLAFILRWRDRRSLAILLTGSAIFFVWIGFTHLLPRFLVMIIPVAGLLIAQIRWSRAWPIAAVLAIAAAALGWHGVYPRLAYTTRDVDRCQLIGLQDLSWLVPPELADMKSTDKQVGLVGDAEAFLFQIPMSRLHYRSVFDLPADVVDPIDAWVGRQCRDDPNWLLVVNPTEITRLHKTYWKTPPLPLSWAKYGDQTFVWRGDQLPGELAATEPDSTAASP